MARSVASNSKKTEAKATIDPSLHASNQVDNVSPVAEQKSSLKSKSPSVSVQNLNQQTKTPSL